MAKIIRAMTRDGSARAIFTESTSIVNRAIEIHKLMPTAAAALGRLLTCTSMIASLMPERDNLLTLTFKGDGEGGNIVVSGDYLGNVRGYIANPAADPPRRADKKLDVGRIVGNGMLYVLRDTGEAEPYVGISEIVSGEIAEDIASYFAKSEQIPTICAAGVLIGRDGKCLSSGGALIQLLPFADEGIIDILEENANRAPPISTILADNQLSENALLETADIYLAGIEFDVFDQLECDYVCYCSREKTTRALSSLGKTELTEIRDSPEKTLLTCQFCDRVYEYTKEEIHSMLEAL